MARIITIEIQGAAGQYTAEVRKIQEAHKQLYNQATQGAQQAANAVKIWETSIAGLNFALGKLGISLSFLAGLNFLDQFSAFAEQLNQVSKRSGIAVEDLHALERIVVANEGSFEELSTGLVFLQRALAKASDATSEESKALKILGVTSRDPLTALFQLSDAMKNNLDANNRLLAARLLLGRASVNLVETLSQGSTALRAQIEEMKSLGVISSDFAKRVDEARDSWALFKDLLSVKIGQPVIEGLLDIANFLDRIGNWVQEKGENFRKFLNSIAQPGDFRFAVQAPEISGHESVTDALAREAQEAAANKNKIDLASALKADELGNKQREALAKVNSELLKLKLASDQAKLAQRDFSVDVVGASKAIIEQETAAQLAAAAHDNLLTPALRRAIEQVRQYKLAAVDQTEADRKKKEAMDLLKTALEVEDEQAKITAEAWDAYAKSIEVAHQKELDEISIKEQLANIEADRLALSKRNDEAEVLRLQARIAALQELKKQTVDTRLIDAQIALAQAQLQKVGSISVDIGKHIGNTLNNIFSSLISGTLKSVDIGKAALATIGSIATDIFGQIIKQKLLFEIKLFTNLKQLPGQANSALLSGGGGGGILQTLLFGAGSAVLQGAGANLPSMGGVPAGGTTVSGTGGGGFGSGGLISGTISTISTLLQNTQLGTYVTTFLASLSATISTTISSMLTTLATNLAKIPGYGWIAAAVVAAISIIYRIVANQQERPNALLSGQFGGVAFDPESGQFVPGDIAVAIGRKVGIKNSQAGSIATNLEQRLTILANQWTDILNIFPNFVAEDIIPALEETNRRLNQNFANLKFSPGGSRNIQQELNALSGPDGLIRFFNAFQPAIAAGFRASLERAGTPVSTAGFEAINIGFGKTTPQGMDALIAVIKDMASLTSQLGRIGAAKFLPETDVEGLQSIFSTLFGVTNLETFTTMAQNVKEQLQPVLDALNQSVQEATNLFGRGLIAAMEAATESDARLAFLNSLNTGIKDTVFKGLTDAFIASAQFGDLLAPIQKQIRIFTEAAFETGQPPDIAAFRTAILPAIEEISSRADLLGPLVDALQGLGFEIRSILGLVPPEETPAAPVVPAGPVQVTINVTGSGDPEAVAREIDKLLRAQLAPPI